MQMKQLCGAWLIFWLALAVGGSVAVAQQPPGKERGGESTKDTGPGSEREKAKERGPDAPPLPRIPERRPAADPFGTDRPGGFPDRRGDPRRPGMPEPAGRRPEAGAIGRFPPGPPFPRQPAEFGRGPAGGVNLEELKKYDPEMYELENKDLELERQTFDLSQQYRRAPREQRETLKTQLQDLVQKHFEARQNRRQLQLKRLEEELERMRTAMQRRTEMQGQIVERRVSELIGDRSDLDF